MRPVPFFPAFLLYAFVCYASLVNALDLVGREASVPSCTLSASGGDDSTQFVQAVQACDTVLVPPGTILNISTPMNMTGLKNKHLSIQGTVLFNPDIPYWSGNGYYFPFQTQITFWILGGENIRLDGGGTLDGAGQVWYDTFAGNSSLMRPITLTIYQATNVIVENITMLNAPEWFNFVNEGEGVVYNNVTLNATSYSQNPAKNTDGWDIYRSNNVIIQNSIINNGDDCVSYKPNATNMVVNNLQCNGSHGISVGSLGQYAGEYDLVENVTASNVHISNAENGARIKMFAGPGVGSGLVKNISFSNFTESNVDNPLIIDQCYMTSAANCTAYPSNTYIEYVSFDNLSGTSSGAEKSVVASLGCSPDGRCENITVNNLDLMPPASYGNATYSCQNVNVTGNAAYLFTNCTVT